MIRALKHILPAALLAAALGGGLTLAAASPAAAADVHLCESSGSFCVGSNTTSWGETVWEVSPPGRDLVFRPDDGCFTWNGTCYPTGVLNFYGIGPNTCAVSTGSGIVLGACSGVDGDVWAQVPVPNGHVEFLNRHDTQTDSSHRPKVLTGHNLLHADFFTECSVFLDQSCNNNNYQRFDETTS